ncbi:uncharacterized protein LOC112685152 [Sipha flava]|uniref:Uncharacterized protein LOC112685152 n=1 Tax=Sipha flava TaxID=143950 RepID=A0A8B8FQG5_9HEMI|nr:uncharacterized protein LOC112685152 [Sipha flava]
METTRNTLANIGVSWRFIPPRSPHFGGLWEAAVKSMKILLGRILGETRLTFEELSTLLTRAEACLNSRLITTLSSDPSNPPYLTPAHFLIGDSLIAVPEPDITNIPLNHLTRWRRITQYSQHLWRRWSSEYLGQLQERSKWASNKGSWVKPGTVVLVKEDNLPAFRWRLGMITSVQRGSDGVIRSANVKTQEGHYQRAVRKLCPLPFEGNVENA